MNRLSTKPADYTAEVMTTNTKVMTSTAKVTASNKEVPATNKEVTTPVLKPTANTLKRGGYAIKWYAPIQQINYSNNCLT